MTYLDGFSGKKPIKNKGLRIVRQFECTVCKSNYKSRNANSKYCSNACKSTYQTCVIDFADAAKVYESGNTLIETAAIFSVTVKVITNLFKRNKYKCRKAIKRDQSGVNNAYWKGDSVTYEAFHKRVAASKGKANKCTQPECEGKSKRYDWANMTGRYEDVDDYVMMCRTCHFKYDKIGGNFKKQNVNNRKILNERAKLS